MRPFHYSFCALVMPDGRMRPYIMWHYGIDFRILYTFGQYEELKLSKSVESLITEIKAIPPDIVCKWGEWGACCVYHRQYTIMVNGPHQAVSYFGENDNDKNSTVTIWDDNNIDPNITIPLKDLLEFLTEWKDFLLYYEAGKIPGLPKPDLPVETSQ